MTTWNELTDCFTVSSQETHIRLDKLLALRFPEHSRTYFQFLIEQGYVLVNGSPLKKRAFLKMGDEVDVCFLLTPEIPLEPENIPLEILYEDDDLIAVNKPPQMVVHPAPGHPNQTFVNALLFHCRHLKNANSIRPGIVHRLDKDTSGVLLAAKTMQSHAKLVELFSQRHVQKEYLAICIGKPKEGLIDAPIKRHSTQRKKMTTCFSEGKEAKSICRVLKNNEQLSLVEIQLLTGRTHQIRVHLKHLGTPILGDPTYGFPAMNKKFSAHRQLLHARRLKLSHPLSGIPLDFLAPIPKDFLPYLENFKIVF